MSLLRKDLSFGFEQTFTIPDWWTDPGFVATSDTPLKIEKMKLLAQNIAKVISGRWVQSEDIYKHIQFETFDAKGDPSFVVTMDPGSIEVKTQPLFLDGMAAAIKPLFDAAELSGLVAYRNWWYGVKTGTEGGCHVNMAGLTTDSNPLYRDPALVIKYAAFFHNHPCIHYPFMGVDVGPGGNCMRMDEHALDPHSKHAPGSFDSEARFTEIAARINNGEKFTPQQIALHFKGSKLAEDKHSAPSFYKFKEPLYFIEDRAVEALRSPEDFALVSELRVKILETLQLEPGVRPLEKMGPGLHLHKLSSASLWADFQDMCVELKMEPEAYRIFFERQFPRLLMGECVPTRLEIREGRRPRVITDVKMRGDLMISKTVDTSFARLEIFWPEAPGENLSCLINQRRYPVATILRDGQRVRCLILDYQKPQNAATLDIALVDERSIKVIEKARFHPIDMTFKATDFEVDFVAILPALSGTSSTEGYVDVSGITSTWLSGS